MKSKYELGHLLVTYEPTDPTLKFNGGDYEEYSYPIVDENQKTVLELQYSSADFDVCQLSGNSGRLVNIKILDIDLWIKVQEFYYNYENGDEVTVDELLQRLGV